MGLSYTASVFYGTFVPVNSAIGKRLMRLMEKNETSGSTTSSGSAGVELGYAGAWNNSPWWITIYAATSSDEVGKDDEIVEPRPLCRTDESWRPKILEFLVKRKISADNLPDIGWYFEGSVS